MQFERICLIDFFTYFAQPAVMHSFFVLRFYFSGSMALFKTRLAFKQTSQNLLLKRTDKCTDKELDMLIYTLLPISIFVCRIILALQPCLFSTGPVRHNIARVLNWRPLVNFLAMSPGYIPHRAIIANKN